ncbi:MAG: hypothetical protein AAGA85_14850 [Bacteroidota bacterium]
MKRTLFTVLLVQVSLFSVAQTELSFKAYLNASYEIMHILPQQGWELARPSFGVRQELQGRWYHEMELSRLLLGRTREQGGLSPLDEIITWQFDLALRYTFGYALIEKGPWHFGLGVGAQPRFLRVRTQFGEEETITMREYQLRFSLIPHLAYALGSRWQIDWSPVLNLLETHVVREKETGRDRGETYFPAQAITIRLGLAYRLYKPK